MRIALAAALLLLTAFTGFAQKNDETEIRRVLAASLVDWNRGDVRGFMKSYDASPNTLFIGKAGVTRGHQQVLDNYLKRYPTKESMGTTTFTNLEVKLLGNGHAWVLGNWNLKRDAKAGGDIGGVFTLLLKKTPSGWKVIADHTS
ncbi:MAG: DUF4440 domain-containing protein [Bryobacteraceae bacterium]